jgi:hypothetical protein
MINPRTPAQWREAATWASVLLHLDSARAYGLVTGGPAVNVDRCIELLERAKARGIVPTEADEAVCLRQLVAESSGTEMPPGAAPGAPPVAAPSPQPARPGRPRRQRDLLTADEIFDRRR